MNLVNANEDILIHIDARFDWYNWKNVVILNSKKADGEWGEQVETDQFPFPCCGLIIPIAIRVEMAKSAFVITANGMDVAAYRYREDLGPPVYKVVYRFEGNSATVKAQLKAVTVLY